MADLKAQIEISADASSVEAGVGKAKKSLSDLGTTAASTGKRASDSIGTIGNAGNQSAQKMDAAARNMIGSIQRTIAAMEAGSKGGSEYYRVLANQRGIDANVLKPYLDQLDAVSTKQTKTGISAGQMSAALRGVPAQFTDIAVSLQGGQQPLTVFLQQGGQLKDMFGGIGPAAKALGGYIVGLITPFTVSAAAAIGLAYAVMKGREEFDALNNTIKMTGGYTGLTTKQIGDMAARIALTGAGISDANEALRLFIANGKVSGDQLEGFGRVALEMAKDTGTSIEKVVANLSSMGDDVVKWAVKYNEQFHFMTAAQYELAKQYVDTGDKAAATKVIIDALHEAHTNMYSKASEEVGYLTQWYREWGVVIERAKRALMGLGVPDSNDDKLSAALVAREGLERKLQAAEKSGNAGRIQSLKQLLDSNLTYINSLRDRGDAERKAAKERAETAAQTQRAINLDNYLDDTRYADNKTKYSLEVQKENAAFAAAVKGFDTNSKEYEKALARHKANLAQIAEQNKDKNGPQLDKAMLGFDIDAIKKANEQLIAVYDNSEKILEARRSAGLITDKDYYEAKREFIRLDEAAQEVALQKQIARYQQEQLTGKGKVENDRKIADAQAAILKLRENAAAKQELLAVQEEAAGKRLELSYLTARQAAQDYFDVLERQQARSLEGMGQGAQKRDYNAGINQIEDRYASQRRDLENQKAQLELEGKFTDDSRKQYEQRLSIIDEFQRKSIASYSAYYSDLMKKQGDWALGANEGLQNYLDQSKNVFKQTEDLVSNAFKGMEDALVNFVMTGKLSFSDFARSVIAEIARIQAKQMLSGIFGGGSSGSGIGSLISAGLSFMGGAGGSAASYSAASTASAWSSSLGGGIGLRMPMANGGYAAPNTIGEVNERGPELLSVGGKDFLLTGNQGGSITPNEKLGGSMQITYAPQIQIDSRTDRAEVAALVDKAVQQGNAQLVDKLQRARRI